MWPRSFTATNRVYQENIKITTFNKNERNFWFLHKFVIKKTVPWFWFVLLLPQLRMGTWTLVHHKKYFSVLFFVCLCHRGCCPAPGMGISFSHIGMGNICLEHISVRILLIQSKANKFYSFSAFYWFCEMRIENIWHSPLTIRCAIFLNPRFFLFFIFYEMFLITFNFNFSSFKTFFSSLYFFCLFLSFNFLFFCEKIFTQSLQTQPLSNRLPTWMRSRNYIRQERVISDEYFFPS